MSEVSITIPLSYLKDAKDLTAQGILDSLENSQRVIQLEQLLASLKQSYKQYSARLDEALDTDNQMEKANRLRQIAREMKEIANNV